MDTCCVGDGHCQRGMAGVDRAKQRGLLEEAVPGRGVEDEQELAGEAGQRQGTEGRGAGSASAEAQV